MANKLILSRFKENLFDGVTLADGKLVLTSTQGEDVVINTSPVNSMNYPGSIIEFGLYVNGMSTFLINAGDLADFTVKSTFLEDHTLTLEFTPTEKLPGSAGTPYFTPEVAVVEMSGGLGKLRVPASVTKYWINRQVFLAELIYFESAIASKEFITLPAGELYDNAIETRWADLDWPPRDKYVHNNDPEVVGVRSKVVGLTPISAQSTMFSKDGIVLDEYDAATGYFSKEFNFNVPSSNLSDQLTTLAEYATAGTYTLIVPAGVSQLFLTGGGAGGTGGSNTDMAISTGITGGGGGGGSGATVENYAINVTPGDKVTIVVGAGKLECKNGPVTISGVPGNDATGATGGDTTITVGATVYTLKGGQGGVGNVNSTTFIGYGGQGGAKTIGVAGNWGLSSLGAPVTVISDTDAANYGDNWVARMYVPTLRAIASGAKLLGTGAGLLGGVGDNQTAYFNYEYHNDTSAAIPVTFQFSADNTSILYLNGTQIGTANLDGALGSVPSSLVVGRNIISFKVTNTTSVGAGILVCFDASNKPLFWTDAGWHWSSAKPYNQSSAGGKGADSPFGTGGEGGAYVAGTAGNVGKPGGNCAGGGGAFGSNVDSSRGYFGGKGGDGYVKLSARVSNTYDVTEIHNIAGTYDLIPPAGAVTFDAILIGGGGAGGAGGADEVYTGTDIQLLAAGAGGGAGKEASLTGVALLSDADTVQVILGAGGQSGSGVTGEGTASNSTDGKASYIKHNGTQVLAAAGGKAGLPGYLSYTTVEPSPLVGPVGGDNGNGTDRGGSGGIMESRTGNCTALTAALGISNAWLTNMHTYSFYQPLVADCWPIGNGKLAPGYQGTNSTIYYSTVVEVAAASTLTINYSVDNSGALFVDGVSQDTTSLYTSNTISVAVAAGKHVITVKVTNADAAGGCIALIRNGTTVLDYTGSGNWWWFATIPTLASMPTVLKSSVNPTVALGTDSGTVTANDTVPNGGAGAGTSVGKGGNGGALTAGSAGTNGSGGGGASATALSNNSSVQGLVGGKGGDGYVKIVWHCQGGLQPGDLSVIYFSSRFGRFSASQVVISESTQTSTYQVGGTTNLVAPDGAYAFDAVIVGAGAGGGSGGGASQGKISGGGGGGSGYVNSFSKESVSGGATVIVNVGKGGVGGAATANGQGSTDGADGAASSLTIDGFAYTVQGGKGGKGGSNVAGGAGGEGQVAGTAGQTDTTGQQTGTLGGNGGAVAGYGTGGIGVAGGSNPGTGFGAGGSGGAAQSVNYDTDWSGGNGSDGYIKIVWYIRTTVDGTASNTSETVYDYSEEYHVGGTMPLEIPDGAISATVEMKAGGGGGGGASSGEGGRPYGGGGGGGGEGGTTPAFDIDLTGATSVTLTVGTGGAGGSPAGINGSYVGSPGGEGGASSIAVNGVVKKSVPGGKGGGGGVGGRRTTTTNAQGVKVTTNSAVGGAGGAAGDSTGQAGTAGTEADLAGFGYGGKGGGANGGAGTSYAANGGIGTNGCGGGGSGSSGVSPNDSASWAGKGGDGWAKITWHIKKTISHSSSTELTAHVLSSYKEIVLDIKANVTSGYSIYDAAKAAGWDGIKVARVTVNVFANVSVTGMTSGTGWPAGCVVIINNSGYILGALAPDTSKSVGGNALTLADASLTTTVNNLAGAWIAGGGGSTGGWSDGLTTGVGGYGLVCSAFTGVTLNNLGVICGGGGSAASGDSGGTNTVNLGDNTSHPGWSGSLGQYGISVKGNTVTSLTNTYGLNITAAGENWRGGAGSNSGLTYSAGYGESGNGRLYNVNNTFRSNKGGGMTNLMGRGQTGFYPTHGGSAPTRTW